MTLIDNLVDYIVNGNCTEGSFKWYLLVGDLYGAVNTAGDINILQIVTLTKWLCNNAPSMSFQREEWVVNWIRGGGLLGMRGAEAVERWKQRYKIE